MFESLFNKVAWLTPILKKILQRLLLHCTCTTHCYHGVIRFTFTFFLIISTTTVNISDVCFGFKLKRPQRIRSSHQSCFIIKGVLRNFAKFTGKHLCQSLFFNKVAGLSPATLLRKRLCQKFLPVTFAKFLRTTFLQNTSRRQLLKNLNLVSHFH